MPTLVLTHPSCVRHDPGPHHPESPRRLVAILEELRTPAFGDVVTWSDAPMATREDVERVHLPTFVDRLHEIDARGGGPLDPDTFMGPGSLEAAFRAAGAAMAVTTSTLGGVAGFAAVRPPGHHATATTAMGFCLVNAIVVAARAALVEHGLERILIVDWDVHHGNGTQALVEDDPRIRYVSLHQWPHYPGTGRAEERGVGNVFNVPRPPGLPRETYVADLDAAVHRAVDGWPPQLLLISAGYDAMAGDPLGGFTLEPEDYAAWVHRWRDLDVPIGAVLEGGYAPERIRLAVGATVRALA